MNMQNPVSLRRLKLEVCKKKKSHPFHAAVSAFGPP